MTRFFIALVAATLAGTASAQAPVLVQGKPSVQVSYADLDIHSPSGRTRLADRIRSAATSLCTDPNIDPLDVRLARMECYRLAVADGIAQMSEIAG